MSVFIWILLFLVCWVLGAFILRTAWQATRNQTPVAGSWTVKSGEHSGGGNEVLGLWLLGVVLFVAPFGVYALFGHGGSIPTTPAAATTPDSPNTTEYRFTTPGDNIACVMRSTSGGDETLCDVQKKTWSSPKKPASCAASWGKRVSLTSQGASFACGDGNILRERTVLKAGMSNTVGATTCTSTGVGVNCTLHEHGFQLSAAAYKIF